MVSVKFDILTLNLSQKSVCDFPLYIFFLFFSSTVFPHFFFLILLNDMASLPVYEGPVDVLRFGLKSLESGANAPHPVAQLQKLQVDAEWAGKMDMVRRTYGSHMAMRLSTERALLSRDHRLPGLQSTHAGLNTLTGADTRIDFTDYLSGTDTFHCLHFRFLRTDRTCSLFPQIPR